MAETPKQAPLLSGILKDRREILTAFVMFAASAIGLFVMNVVLARTVDVTSYGQISYALTVTGVAALVATFGLPNASMKYLAEYLQLNEPGKIRALVRFALTRVGCVSIALAAGLGLIAVYATQDGRGTAQGLVLAAMLLPFTAVGLWRSKASRGLQHLRHSLLPEGVVRPYLVIVLFLGVSLAGQELSFALTSLLLLMAYAAALALGLWLLARSIPRGEGKCCDSGDVAAWRKSFSAMFLIDIMQEFFLRCDFIVAGWSVDPHEIGIYAAASKLAALNLFFMRIVDTVYAPKMSACAASGDRNGCWILLKQSAAVSATGSLPAFLILIAMPGQLLGLFGQEFTAGKQLLLILATGQYINALTGSVGYAVSPAGLV